MFDVGKPWKVMAVEGVNGSRVRGGMKLLKYMNSSVVRVGSGAQVSVSSPASSLGDMIARGSKDIGLGIGIGSGVGMGS